MPESQGRLPKSQGTYHESQDRHPISQGTPFESQEPLFF